MPTPIPADDVPRAPEYSLGCGETVPTVFEMADVGDTGYDNDWTTPHRGLDTARAVRCAIGVGLAIVAIQAIAWWGFRADPVGLAPMLPAEISFLIPQELRPIIVADQPPSEETMRDVVAGSTAVTPAVVSGPLEIDLSVAPDVQDEIAETSLPNDTSTVPEFIPDVTTVTSASFEEPASSRSQVVPAEGTGYAGGAAVPAYLSSAAPPPRMHPETIFVDNGPRWSPTFKHEDVTAAIAATRKSSENFRQTRIVSSQNTDLMKSAKLFYVVTCNLAERATMVDQDGAATSLASSRALLQDLSVDPTTHRMFSNAARNWVNRKIGAGIATAAKVNAIRAFGDLFEISIELNDSKSTLATVMTRLNPADNPWTTFAVGDRILFFGVIVDDPEVRLPGYLGNEFWVIYMTDQVVRMP